VEIGQEDEYVGAGAIADAGGADCGELGEFAAAIGFTRSRCETTFGRAGEILREDGAIAGADDGAGVQAEGDRAEKLTIVDSRLTIEAATLSHC